MVFVQLATPICLVIEIFWQYLTEQIIGFKALPIHENTYAFRHTEFISIIDQLVFIGGPNNQRLIDLSILYMTLFQEKMLKFSKRILLLS